MYLTVKTMVTPSQDVSSHETITHFNGKNQTVKTMMTYSDMKRLTVKTMMTHFDMQYLSKSHTSKAHIKYQNPLAQDFPPIIL